MKSTLVALFLFVALSTRAQEGVAKVNDAEYTEVFDTSGNKLRAGVNYYVSGLSLASAGVHCPLYVVAADQGLALTFTPINPEKRFIRGNTDLNIKFSTNTSCPHESTVLKLKSYDDKTGQWFVATGGVLGNPGRQTLANWFQIVKYYDAYALFYCPRVCKDCHHQCMNVGIYEDQYGKRLALVDYDEPYKVQFQLAA
ncbi:hypothetical protein RJT34_26072 [Clitoria ternatea]|uniref:Miraculin n=1 Tax=Clitoria ternatea TaxID=43366 RepID=A0AAN9IAB1_CLITE